MVALLDIEGTVCSISFVKETLYPYFLETYASTISTMEYPITGERDEMSAILSGFPTEAKQSQEALKSHISHLVSNDIKDPVLKAFQGKVWKLGYAKGELKAPVYSDAIEFFERSDKTYIYSSGSVAAQKLLFAHVDVNGCLTDLTPKLAGYFDITTSGYKQEQASYASISSAIGVAPKDITFYSDNINEIKAAHSAGLATRLVVRPGNEPVSEQDKAVFTVITTFDDE
ncbi:2,3-diketo-5-methylthio-1-phosphopentane phosphatase [Metschnikowia bicuspidata var. bicuspidata NRRL YB-4993]|uniref:Enolase-phosphatase E1 n=1 Tax=Metschnikowia bicuspidata var. bicuspidata NRRL YB-4993 TaxID=869754 RepID=A0A1A0HCZ0_9ASCO|nr:2,3-diketo-5-methylthio-1-phosphopentane phosphatase [Metschnikowia bicuspidata var. bicuspidata NRRL YB-4993]OBA21803.1 2,3-diketo-5-methylthio-1-phosphopentane phosphatase [Metschnikowia bicuspidata var. bicuspidata NRRL YB-4993]